MKTRIAVAIASLFVASLGAAAFAQGVPQQTTPPATASTSMSANSMSMSNPDTRIDQKIKHELTAHGVTATNVMVSFSNGTATLSGTVDSKADIKKAKSAAMRVRGVKHVDTSGLQVQNQVSQG